MTEKRAKDFYKLFRNIGKLTNGQARVVTWDDEDLTTFQIEIAPSGGLYANGKFLFEIFQDDPEGILVPIVFCSTDIYHPNIDTIAHYDSKVSNVCVSLLDHWDASMDMEDLVQAILFLFYHPNLGDPLSFLIAASCNVMEEFGENVKRSLMGEEIEGHEFEANFGYIENGFVNTTENDIATIDSDLEDTKDCFANKVENEIITDIEKLDLKEDTTASTLDVNNIICDEEQTMEELSIVENSNTKQDKMTATSLKCQNKGLHIGAMENHLNAKQSLVVTEQNTLLSNIQQNWKELDFRTRNCVDNSLVRCTFLVASICRHFVRKFVKWKKRS